MLKLHFKFIAYLIVAAFSLLPGSSLMAGTLEDVRARDKLICGVSEGLTGFSEQTEGQGWSGFDVDYCRAVAAAVLGDADKVSYVPLSATARFEALKDKKIDILARNTSWTLKRDVAMKFTFVGTSYYDGQGFMTRRSYGISSALQLSRASICVLEGTTSELNAARYFESRSLSVQFLKFKERGAMVKAYNVEKCDALSADRSGLASDRVGLSQPDEHVLLPEVISKEPLGPVVRQEDLQWSDLTRWVLFLLINAEEWKWTQDAALEGRIPDSLSLSEDVTAALGLRSDWPINVIGAVGHYGEIFERNIGRDSPLELTRGVNALWSGGGILFAPPMR
ncbi:MAG: amino acid ABC transporter substrate-binding protein [Rhodomicrobium sp.]|nr:MAG: amino acid ABC transporter substrate-binding protein [Rhodomicrobium sp.]